MYDCIIVGSGPAGITAGIYLARANKKVLVLERKFYGGILSEIGTIENYPGCQNVAGFDLAQNMYKQAKALGVEFVSEEALEYDFGKDIKIIKTTKRVLESKSIILALGNTAKQLECENEKEFFGKGVSYCATCDGNFFKNKVVGVVGSGDRAWSNAKYLSGSAKKDYIFSKYEKMHFKSYNHDELKEYDNIEFLPSALIYALSGEGKLEVAKYNQNNEQKEIKVDGLFVSIGSLPNTENLQDKITLDEQGYVVVDDEMNTSQEGVFSAGDVTTKSTFKQIVTATAQGAIASASVLKYLMGK